MATPTLPSLLVALGANAHLAEPDGELLSRFVASGEEVAFAALVRRYARLVWRVARTRCRSEATAEEVFQATFVVLARKAASVRSASALPGWLHRTAYRLAVKAARRERPAASLPTDIPVSADPLDALSAREFLAAVDDELARLSDAERSVLVLCGVENQSLDEAATRLGCTAGAVKGRLERARAKLRTRLDARGLTLPAVALTLVSGPPARAVEAAVTPPGGPIPPAVEQLLSGGTHMTRRFVALGLAAALVVGGVGTGFGLVPRGGPAAASAAPVPKEKASPVVWSEPLKVDWQASYAQRLAGIWTPDGKSVLVPSPTVVEQDEKLDFGGVGVRDAATGKVTKRLAFKPNGKVDQMFLPQSLAVSPDGRTVYAAGSLFAPGGKGEAARGVVTWKDVSTNDPPEVVVSADPPEDPIALSADGKQLGVVEGNTLDVFATATGKVLWRSEVGGGKRGKLTALAHQMKESAFLVGTSGGECVYCDAANGRTLMSVTKLGVDVRAATVSGDGKVTAFGGRAIDKGAALVIVGKEMPANAVPEKVSVHGLAFSPDGRHLVAACSDGVVRVFDVATGKQAASAKEHKEAVFCVAYSPDGKKLLTVGREAVKVWDVEAVMKAK